MAGMLIKGGAGALVGTGIGSQPLMTSSPAAATTAQSASDIAYGPGGTTSSSGGGGLFGLSGHSVICWTSLAFMIAGVALYRTLPK